MTLLDLATLPEVHADLHSTDQLGKAREPGKSITYLSKPSFCWIILEVAAFKCGFMLREGTSTLRLNQWN